MQSRGSRSVLAPLLIAQFLGAFIDNAWKLIVAFLGIRSVAEKFGSAGPEFEAAAQTQVTVAFLVLALPLMLVSLPAGILSDRMSKRTLIIVLKGVEVALMAGGTLALLADPAGGLVFLFIVLGLTGAQSALLSPAKYGILPELLPQEQLPEGNGLLEMWTFFAIILGTYSGGLLLGLAGNAPWLAGLALTVLALAGFLVSWAIPIVPPARSEGGVSAAVRGAWAAIRADRVLRGAVAGTIFFWALASLVSQDILVYAKAVLGLSEAMVGLPLTVLAFGIGVGSLLAGRLSRGTVEYGLIPSGALGIALVTLLIGLHAPGVGGTFLLMALLGLASGLVVVPLNVLIQWKSPGDRRGAVIAFSNVFVFGGVIIGSLSVEMLSRLGLSPREIFLAASGIAGAGALWALWLLGRAFLSFVAGVVFRVGGGLSDSPQDRE
ncbi:MAG: MFS transporter [Nitrospira sp.]|nr:MFS transporter [Nitrospira sp.]